MAQRVVAELTSSAASSSPLLELLLDSNGELMLFDELSELASSVKLLKQPVDETARDNESAHNATRKAEKGGVRIDVPHSLVVARTGIPRASSYRITARILFSS